MYAITQRTRTPWLIVAASLALMALGLAGINRGDELVANGDLFSRQLMWVGIAIPVCIACSLMPLRWLQDHATGLFLVSVMLLIAVFAFPPRGGSRRWIPLGFMLFQPSELAKIVWIAAMSRYLMYRNNFRTLRGLAVPFLLTLLPTLLVLKEPDLGTALLFVPTLFAMLFTAGARWQHLLLVLGLGIATSPLFWISMNPYQRYRVTAVFLQSDAGPAQTGFLYQLHQSKQMLSLGGAWGSELTGPAVDDPAAYRLPAGRTDFVICLVGERFGLWGVVLTAAAYLVIFGRGLMIAAETDNPFARLTTVGLVTLFAAQTVVNLGMTVGLMPVTGITLPFMSYGGSSLLFTAAGVGLLINFGRQRSFVVAPDPFRYASSATSRFDRLAVGR